MGLFGHNLIGRQFAVIAATEIKLSYSIGFRFWLEYLIGFVLGTAWNLFLFANYFGYFYVSQAKSSDRPFRRVNHRLRRRIAVKFRKQNSAFKKQTAQRLRCVLLENVSDQNRSLPVNWICCKTIATNRVNTIKLSGQASDGKRLTISVTVIRAFEVCRLMAARSLGHCALTSPSMADSVATQCVAHTAA